MLFSNTLFQQPKDYVLTLLFCSYLVTFSYWMSGDAQCFSAARHGGGSAAECSGRKAGRADKHYVQRSPLAFG